MSDFVALNQTYATANGEPVQIGKGDLVTFPKGKDCVWEIKEHVSKQYLFG